MKPIIITIKDNKISMSVEEFKKYIEDAYHQGYHDASSISTSNNPYWWRDLTCDPIPTLTGHTALGASDRTTATLCDTTAEAVTAIDSRYDIVKDTVTVAG